MIIVNKCPQPPTGAQLGTFKAKGCMVEMGHKDTGFPVEGYRMIHDKNRAKVSSLQGRGATPTTPLAEPLPS